MYVGRSQDEAAEHLSAMTLSGITPIRPLCRERNEGLELEHLYNGIELELLQRDEQHAMSNTQHVTQHVTLSAQQGASSATPIHLHLL